MIVDDEPQVAAMLQDLVVALGYIPQVARSGQGAPSGSPSENLSIQ